MSFSSDREGLRLPDRLLEPDTLLRSATVAGIEVTHEDHLKYCFGITHNIFYYIHTLPTPEDMKVLFCSVLFCSFHVLFMFCCSALLCKPYLN